jgi:hypothetical protein
MPSDIFKKRANLTKRERKYCSCLLKVRDKSPINPYAICTSSIYSQQGKYRNKTVNCDINYEYEKIPMSQLRSLAKERKVSIYNKNKNKNKKGLTKKATLISRISKDITTKRSKYYKSLKAKAKGSK